VAQETAVLVLAAGKGTRMKSDLIKVLHPLMGQPMLAHVLHSARYLEPALTVVVVGHQADRVREAFPDSRLTFVLQAEQKGTGHAVAVCREALDGFDGTVLILSGDVPLLSPQTMMDFLEAHHQLDVILSVLTVAVADPAMYGRVIRGEDGFLSRIVEARDASPEELAVPEINTGIYAVEARFLFEAVGRLQPENDQKEYYLTDVAADANRHGYRVAAIMGPEPEEVLGINDRVDLAAAIRYLRHRINHSWMRAGVTMIDPFSVYIETTVRLAEDVTLWPGVVLQGRTTVGRNVVIGPGAHLVDARVETGARIGAGASILGGLVPEGTEVAPGQVIRPD
jgi:bifunctional UDP-N-acetylglucosamine pyrophosphorylase/glucosamine-1-phosphate N-acetyltransferase